MHIEILVEDESTKALIDVVCERLDRASASGTHHVTAFRGKQRMLSRLPGAVHALIQASFADSIVIVIDQDRDDCHKLKQQVLDLVSSESFTNSRPELYVRIATTELESWFLGDPEAVRASYPRLSARDLKLGSRLTPDEIQDAAQWLQRLLIRRGYYVGRMPKVEVARNIAAYLDLDPDHNASRSFRLFLRTLREVYGLPTETPSSQSPST